MSILVCVAGVPERPEYRDRGAESARTALRDVWSNRRARILLGVFFFDTLSLSFLATMFPFVAEYTSVEVPEVSAAVAVGAALLAFPLYLPLSRRFGKRRTWIAASAAKAAAFGVLTFEPALAPLAIVVIGATLGSTVVLAPSVKSDIVELDERSTGERKEGAYFASWNLAAKAATGVAVVLGGLLLGAIDFEPNASQTRQAQGLIALLFSAVPCALHTLATVLLSRLDLGVASHAPTALATRVTCRWEKREISSASGR